MTENSDTEKTGDDRIIVVDETHPWLGLLPFREAQSEFFFGRDAEIDEILERIQENALTILYGQSGLGKTSLLGAGVVPKLSKVGYRPELLRLDHDPRVPSLVNQTLYALRRILPSDCWPDDADHITLWELFHRQPSALPVGSPVPVLLIDQFEEIFTIGQSDTAARRRAKEWFTQMADLIQNRPPDKLEERFSQDRKLARQYDFARVPLRVVFALREDYLSHLEAWKTRLPLLTQNRMNLRLLNGPQALEAVVRPGNMGSHPLVNRAVGASIVRFVARAERDTPLQEINAVPPLLSLICAELNDARLRSDPPGREITAELVADQSDDILQDFYTRCFSGSPSALQEFVEDRMVTVGGHRNVVARDDAVDELQKSHVRDPEGALSSLIDQRLLSAEEKGGIQRLEITHDVLVPLAVRSRNERKEVRQKEEAERARIQAESQAARDRKERNRLRLIAAVACVAAGLAIVGGIFGWTQWKRSNEANQRAISSAKDSAQAEARIETERKLREERERFDEERIRKSNEEKQQAFVREQVERQRAQTERERAQNLVDFLWRGSVRDELRSPNPDSSKIVFDIQEKINSVYSKQPEIVERSNLNAFEFVCSYLDSTVENAVYDPTYLLELDEKAKALADELEVPELRKLRNALNRAEINLHAANLKKARSEIPHSLGEFENEFSWLPIVLELVEGGHNANVPIPPPSVDASDNSTWSAVERIDRAVTAFSLKETKIGIEGIDIYFEDPEGGENIRLTPLMNSFDSTPSMREVLFASLVAWRFSREVKFDVVERDESRSRWSDEGKTIRREDYGDALAAGTIHVLDMSIAAIKETGADSLSSVINAFVADLEISSAIWKIKSYNDHVSAYDHFQEAYHRIASLREAAKLPSWLEQQAEGHLNTYARTTVAAWYDSSTKGTAREELEYFHFPAANYFGTKKADRTYVLSQMIRYRRRYPFRNWTPEIPRGIKADSKGIWRFQTRAYFILYQSLTSKPRSGHQRQYLEVSLSEDGKMAVSTVRNL